MPISHPYKLIFVHIPKTGGTSIEYALGMHGELNDVGIKPYLKQKKNKDTLFGGGLQHMTINEIKKYLGRLNFSNYSRLKYLKYAADKIINTLLLDIHENRKQVFTDHFCNHYLKFSIVRNPYERLISHISWINGNWVMKKQLTKQQVSDFILNLVKNKNYNISKHLMPQNKFIYLGDNLMMDMVLRFETLEEDFDKLCNHLKIKKRLSLRMKSYHEHFENYYTEETKEIVYKIYKKDFDLFEYCK